MTPKDGSDTREKLLLAAVAVFADKGYKAATVREICRRPRAPTTTPSPTISGARPNSTP